MKRTERLASATAPDGTVLTLTRHDGAYRIQAGGVELMSTRRHRSEERFGEVACAPLANVAGARVLIGGLGLGFTLRAALAVLAPDAEVVVAELVAAVIDWNRNAEYGLAADALADARVTVRHADVADVLRESRAAFDAVLLDVDNGAESLTTAANAALYGGAGIRAAVAALRPNGRLAYWSAGADPAFEAALRRAGLAVEVERVRAHAAGGPRHTLFVARSVPPVQPPVQPPCSRPGSRPGSPRRGRSSGPRAPTRYSPRRCGTASDRPGRTAIARRATLAGIGPGRMFAPGEQSCHRGRLAPRPFRSSTWEARMSRRVARCAVLGSSARVARRLAAIAAAAVLCGPPAARAQVPAAPKAAAPRAGARSTAGACHVEGIWDLTSVAVNGKDQPLQGRRERKFVDRGHFMWISESGRSTMVPVRATGAGTSTDSTRTTPITGGSGTYSLAGNVYTEHLEYFFDPRRERQSLLATCRTEGDRWYHTYSWPDDPATANGRPPETTEVWRRVR